MQLLCTPPQTENLLNLLPLGWIEQPSTRTSLLHMPHIALSPMGLQASASRIPSGAKDEFK